jgi:hypothetical protein
MSISGIPLDVIFGAGAIPPPFQILYLCNGKTGHALSPAVLD